MRSIVMKVGIVAAGLTLVPATTQPAVTPATDLNKVCPLNRFATVGQPFNFSGGSSGVTADSKLQADYPTDLGQSWFERDIRDSQKQDWGQSQNVGLIIFDSFAHDLPVTHLPNYIRIAHGDLVLAHARALIEGSGRFRLVNIQRFNSGKSRQYEYQAPGGKRSSTLFVRTVSTDGMTGARDIFDRLSAARTALRSGDKLISRVVVNMSFSLMPCEIVEAVKNSKNEAALRDKVSDFLKLPHSASDEELLQAYQRALKTNDYISNTNPSWLKPASDKITFPKLHLIGDNFTSPAALKKMSDELTSFFGGPFSSFNYVGLVAASGNLGLDVSTYPAAWPGFISVGAVSNKSGTVDWSNTGDVRRRGGWFRLPVSYAQELGLSVKETSSLRYQGTSFAAPNLSVFLAMDMMRTVPTCTMKRTSATSNNSPLAGIYAERGQKIYRNKIFSASLCK